MTSVLAQLSVKQLHQAIKLRTRMDQLQAKMDQITDSLGNSKYSKRDMLAVGRARIGAAQTARWAKLKDGVGSEVKKTRKKMSASARAKISAAAKLRWAKAKAAGKSRL